MATNVWKAAATMVATHIRGQHRDFHRGLLLIPRVRDNAIVIWMFGNEDRAAGEPTLHEMDILRRDTGDRNIEELGTGFSPDRCTWVMIFRTRRGRYRTKAGRSFQLDMLKTGLDQAMDGAWRQRQENVDAERATPRERHTA